MRKVLCILAVLLMVIVSGCGLVSGTAFVKQDVDETIVADQGGSLDDQFAGAVVDLTDNSDWSDFTIEGIEDGCVALDAWNLLADSVSGEIWITDDTTATARGAIHSVADIVTAGGFRVFSGLALEPGPDDPNIQTDAQHFTCAYTISRLENVDLLVAAVQRGYFVAWGAGDQDQYHFQISGIVFGIHVTGSL